MPRTARKYSESNIYHIYARGDKKEFILKEKEDKEKYIAYIEESTEKFDVKIFAFAIMDNHIHILLKADSENLTKTMKFIQQSYTTYYNKKYKRTGKVFGERYKSKGCNDDVYLTELVKYIHLNPVKEGLGKEFINNYTSNRYYIVEEKTFCDTNYILSFFDEDPERARKIYLEYLNLPFKYTGKEIYE